MKRCLILLLAPLLSLTSCEDASDLYFRAPAHYTCDHVNAIPTLFRACNSYGEFCTITIPIGDTQRFHFDSVYSSDVDNITQQDKARGFILGLGGLIVGLPTTPEMGQLEPRLVCYDISCPGCYEESNKAISKSLTLQAGGYAHCTRCQRTYDINNMGIVSRGEGSRPMLRYNVYYANGVLSVNNN